MKVGRRSFPFGTRPIFMGYVKFPECSEIKDHWGGFPVPNKKFEATRGRSTTSIEAGEKTWRHRRNSMENESWWFVFCVVPLPSKPVTIRYFQHINIFSKRSRTKPLYATIAPKGHKPNHIMFHDVFIFRLWDDRSKAGNDFFDNFLLSKKKNTRFLIFRKMVANLKKKTKFQSNWTF